MSEAFLKSLKWYVMVFIVLIGITCFTIAETYDTVKPVMPGMLCFGAVYVMSSFWTEFRGKVLLFSVITFIGLAFASRYVPDLGFILLGWDQDWFTPFWTRAGTVAAGIPVMTFIFHKYD